MHRSESIKYVSTENSSYLSEKITGLISLLGCHLMQGQAPLYG